MGMIFVLIPLHSVQASFLSFFTKTTEAESLETQPNSQNLFLPQPVRISKDSKKQLLAIDNNALSPKTGPLGTELDVEDLAETDDISVYTVRGGDTLPQIAKMFDVSVNTILWANGLNKKDKIKEGDALVILPVNGLKYVVKKGDTLKGIAKKFDADVIEIERFNGLELDSKISSGDMIIIPNAELEEVSITKKSTSTGLLPLHAWGATRLQKGFDGPLQEGYYIRPVKGCVRTQGLHGRNGVDIGCPVGTPLLAAASGTVIVARTGGWNGGFGNYIVIKHPNGTQTLYGHLQKVSVTTGESVSQGQVIGAVGNTGRSTGSHVHFEVRGAKNPLGDNSKYGLK